MKPLKVSSGADKVQQFLSNISEIKVRGWSGYHKYKRIKKSKSIL